MANAKSNPILKWLALGIVVLVLIMILKSDHDEPEGSEQYNRAQDKELKQALAAMNIDADTPKETVRTLVAHVKSQEDKTNRVLAENQQLMRENQAIDKKVAEEVKVRTRQIKSDLEQQGSSLFNSLTGRMEQLKTMVETQSGTQSSTQPGNMGNPGSGFNNQGDIPIGLGFDDGFSQTDNEGWILPLDLPPADEQGIITLNRPTNHPSETLFNDLSDPARQASAEDKPVAWYTVPENATLMGTTAMTGMIGRIPIGGRVVDPYPFKIIVSSYNLATNGHHIPGLNGMIFSGVATGDLMLSCVSAKLYSVTYTFDDGTILTQRETQGADVGMQEEGGTQRRGLGWLSDEWGNPCIKGELITNAPTYLATQFGLSAAEGYARAAAQNETTSVVTTSGAIVESTTGDAYKRAGGEAVADGVSSISEWLNARQADSFDAIFVPSGSKVAVHIDTELQIDFNPNGRKIAYEHQNRSGYTRHLD